MHGIAHFRMLAGYHRWANELLLRHLDPLSDEDYFADHGLFFNSVHGTLNHVLLVDRLWLARLQQRPYPLPEGLAQQLIQERAELTETLLEQSDKWIEFFADLDERRIYENLAYTTTEGIDVSFPVSGLLAHAFNHGTHHRGQVTAVLSRLGHPTPEMDIPFYLMECFRNV